jgi:tRNA threonylcarbamoyladenosine biosynthesis protein TsaB
VALILNIDTSTEIASVSLARQGVEVRRMLNTKQHDHASWLHTAILELTVETGIGLNQLDACAVTGGPGSYTGIRVGLATVKGICYALGIPLITTNTLQVMAWSQVEHLREMGVTTDSGTAFCPMIDARREEVFTGIYDVDNFPILVPRALILTPESLSAELAAQRIVFFGNGSDKWKLLCKNPNATFQNWDYEYFNLAYLSYQSFTAGAFSDLAYVQPDYLKEFHTYK